MLYKTKFCLVPGGKGRRGGLGLGSQTSLTGAWAKMDPDLGSWDNRLVNVEQGTMDFVDHETDLIVPPDFNHKWSLFNSIFYGGNRNKSDLFK